MTVLDEWSGGASAYRQFRHRAVLREDGRVALESKPMGAPDSDYRPNPGLARFWRALESIRFGLKERKVG